MKKEDALRYLEKMRPFHDSDYGKALDVAIDSVKKQVPKTPNKEFGYSTCANCGVIIFESADRYCSHCGQSIMEK